MMYPSLYLPLPIFLSVLLHQSDSLKPQHSYQKITATSSKKKSASVLKAVTGSRSLLISRKQRGMMEVNELSHSVLCSAPGQDLMEKCTRFLSVSL